MGYKSCEMKLEASTNRLDVGAPEQVEEPRGLPALPAVAELGLPSMPEIALPASADALLAPIPAPRPQGPAAAQAAEAARPYTALYNVLPVLGKASGQSAITVLTLHSVHHSKVKRRLQLSRPRCQVSIMMGQHSIICTGGTFSTS